MAQKVQVLLTCDMETGDKPGDETITFGLDGSTYDIDLCTKHAKGFRETMAPFIDAGRRQSSRGTGRRGASGSNDRERTQAIRAWARKKGIQVSERGRLSSDIVAQYEKSGGK